MGQRKTHGHKRGVPSKAPHCCLRSLMSCNYSIWANRLQIIISKPNLLNLHRRICESCCLTSWWLFFDLLMSRSGTWGCVWRLPPRCGGCVGELRALVLCSCLLYVVLRYVFVHTVRFHLFIARAATYIVLRTTLISTYSAVAPCWYIRTYRRLGLRRLRTGTSNKPIWLATFHE